MSIECSDETLDQTNKVFDLHQKLPPKMTVAGMADYSSLCRDSYGTLGYPVCARKFQTALVGIQIGRRAWKQLEKRRMHKRPWNKNFDETRTLLFAEFYRISPSLHSDCQLILQIC